MRKTSKILFFCILILIILLGCDKEKFTKEDYLNLLANKAGISYSNNTIENYRELKKWGIVSDGEYNSLDDEFDYSYLAKTLSRLLREDKLDLKKLIEKGYVDNKANDSQIVTKEAGLKALDKAIYDLNHKRITPKSEYQLKDDYENKDNFSDVFKKLDIAGDIDVDFSKAEIIPSSPYEKTAYQNNIYELLGTKTNTFYTNGYRISFKFNKSSLTAHISKEIKNAFTSYVDLTITNFKTSYKWKYEDNVVKEAYLKANFSSTEKFGVTKGKNNTLVFDPKNIDKSSFKTIIESAFKKANDVEATIPLCTIKTPIPNVPELYLNFDVFVRIYANGKVELGLYNADEFGFEIIDGKLRMIKDIDNEADLIIGGTTRSVVGINLNLEALKFRLMDLESDFGLNAEAKATIHFLDTQEKDEYDYSFEEMSEMCDKNESIKVCGDVSLNWLLDFKVNSAKTLLYKLGLTKTFSILDEDNQLFNNMRHIENGVFVKKCTVKNKTNSSSSSPSIKVDNIILTKYSCVIKVGESYALPISKLPNNYTNSDLVIESMNSSVVSVSGFKVVGHKKGNAKIKIGTKDAKYEAYFNVLVSS